MKSVARVKKLAQKIDVSALCEALVVRFTKSSAQRADIKFFHCFICLLARQTSPKRRDLIY